MTNILIPTDFSDNSWNAIEYALSFFKNRKCNFYLLHVIDDVEINQSVYHQPYTQLLNPVSETRAKLQILIQKIEKSPLKQNHLFFSLVSVGNIVDSIRSEITDKRIDMIVMGTKGGTGIKKITVGSNTTDVINKVKCTTLVIPEHVSFSPVESIALPTDYNLFFGANILETISEILNMQKAELHIVHLAKKNEPIMGEQLQNKELLEDYFSDDKHNFLSIANKNLDIAIQDCVDHYKIKLIAMVAKNIHFFQQLFFRSNNSATTYQSKVPFLVLHE